MQIVVAVASDPGIGQVVVLYVSDQAAQLPETIFKLPQAGFGKISDHTASCTLTGVAPQIEAASTVNPNAFSQPRDPFVASTVKFDTPSAVGVPEISPVELFSVNPDGNAPAVTLQVSVPVMLVAVSVSE